MGKGSFLGPLKPQRGERLFLAEFQGVESNSPASGQDAL